MATDPEAGKPLWWRRRWVTLSEMVGLGALAVAVLSFCDTRRLHHQEQADRAGAVRREAQAHAFVLRADVYDNGARLMLHPLREEQAVQSQRYLFPRAVLSHAMEVDGEPPQVDVAWVADGLRTAVGAAADARRAKPDGFGRLPVGVVTTYVEDGAARTDRALYIIDYRVTPGGLFGGGPRVFFRGLEFVARNVGPDMQARVDARWTAEPKF